MVAIVHCRKSKWCRGCMFSKAVKMVIFISDVQYYVPLKLCKTVGSIHLFKITGMPNSEYIKLNKNYVWGTLEIDWKEVNVNKLNKNYVWGTLEIDWKEVNVNFNNSKINLSRIVIMKLYNYMDYMVQIHFQQSRNCIRQ